jgi:hypothetical protein
MTKRLLIALLVVGALLVALTTPGVFTIDEPHHIVALAGLRDGGLHLKHTEGLPADAQLFFFSPGSVPQIYMPASSRVPPLYAFLALPFSWLGLRGLFLLNTLSYLAVIAMVFGYARRYAKRPETPWVAAGTFALGGYALEYALGLWPHMLSVALVMGAALLADKARRSSRPIALALSTGVCIGLATGVRYQNVIVAAAIGLALLLWARRRVAAVGTFAVGLAGPLAMSAEFNWLRAGSGNPLSKGKHYLNVGGSERLQYVYDVCRSFWMRTVDFTVHRVGRYQGIEWWPEPDSGAFVVWGEVKKALLQSAPWIGLVLLLTLLAWRSHPLRARGACLDTRAQREIRVVSIIIWAVLCGFAATGLTRTDGVAYNQRYFHEIVPFAALALAWALERTNWRGNGFILSAALGGAIAAVVCWSLPPTAREILIVRVPLVLALLLIVTWLITKRAPKAPSLGAVLGLCLGWSLGVHTADIKASFAKREQQLSVQDEARALLPADEPYAVFGHGAVTHALAPLLLDHNVVILDSARGGPNGTRALLKALFARGRRVFVVANNSGAGFLRFVTRGRGVRERRSQHMVMLELRCSPALGECVP